MEEYKGIYYGDETEQKFYEGGAHFKYNKLYQILEKLAKERNAKEKKQELLYVKKNNKLNKSSNKKTRNFINNIDINKFNFNTINNNYNNINYNIKNNYNIFLSINKENNNKYTIEDNLSLTNHKNEIDSRNKDNMKAFRGRPNTIFKDGLQQILFIKKNKLLSSSMEQKNNKIKFPLNLKRSLPDFNSSNFKRIKDNNNNSYKINNNNNNLNRSSINNKKINIYKNDDIKSIINDNNTKMKTNISGTNGNKISINTERFLPFYEKNSKKKLIVENCEEFKNSNKKSELFHKINITNSIKISRNTHNILNKRIINKKPIINSKTKNIITSEIYIKKSNKKKLVKNNLTFNNKTLFEENKLKNSQYNTIKKESNNERNISDKKLINLKKAGKNKIIKQENNQLPISNSIITKSRNYDIKNTSFQVNNYFNQNLTINNKKNDNNDLFQNYFKTMINMNKTYNNHNKIILSSKVNKTKIRNSNLKTKQNNNNKTSIINILKENSKKKYMIKPYINIKTNNKMKNKRNLDSSIKVKVKINNNFP